MCVPSLRYYSRDARLRSYSVFKIRERDTLENDMFERKIRNVKTRQHEKIEREERRTRIAMYSEHLLARPVGILSLHLQATKLPSMKSHIDVL